MKNIPMQTATAAPQRESTRLAIIDPVTEETN
jgi:hypothetical protein